MKFLSRVVWSEGMYLGPHHFQTQSRYFEDSIAFLVASLWHEPWGFLHFELDQKAIRNGSAVVLHASGVFPDGLTFELPNSDPPPAARNLAEVFPSTDAALPLYLAVPTRKDNGFDCDLKDVASGTRYARMQRVLRDETNGIDEREIELGRKNIRVLTEAELTPEMQSIPIARVLRDGRGHLIYDEEFIPTCLRASASEPLMLLFKRLIETIGEKSATIARSARRHGRFEAGTSALDVANYWFLHALHNAIPPLQHLSATKHAHPEELFVELSRLAGALCTFAVDSDPRTLPSYDHRDPGPGFQALDAHIKRHLEIVVPSNTVTLKFDPTEPYIQEADVVDERCLRRARWVLGVRSSLGESALLNMVPRLVKVCSARFVPELVKRALPGMTLTHLPVPPTAIRAEADMQYFVVETAGPCWEHILQTRKVGVYIPGDLSDPEFDLTVIVEAS
ncbi:type VI secretion system baseplate subunit TssK [Alloacidobacterium dinghuense]|uniref:Type VI secretion system baseplate subunit TssK n=1 Tax=Alloacidobacterium dinghuense TaxID=2763107 RepID=A0A7G8BMM1_9BACT|nr:type VI secretion system baseplate subunit TssK [Alloacidobacterium dinghuense]QNI33791.1 type VI secretion system baseplate subunit TssK [Alloacidobacterium dinghuense]